MCDRENFGNFEPMRKGRGLGKKELEQRTRKTGTLADANHAAVAAGRLQQSNRKSAKKQRTLVVATGRANKAVLTGFLSGDESELDDFERLGWFILYRSSGKKNSSSLGYFL